MLNQSIARSVPALEPTLLGPLTAEPELDVGPFELFAGERRYFSERQVRERVALRDAIAERLALVLQPGERILHIARASHIPPFMQQIGLGVWWSRFYTVALVLTDQRVVEILLEGGGKQAGSRTLSYPWSQVRSLKMGMLSLTLRPSRGRAQQWRVDLKGDRKLLKLLASKIVQHLLEGAAGPPRSVPLWHCPRCAAATESHPRQCFSCGTRFQSAGHAALLSLAFPGAGLFYTGHRVLGALDLLGELVLALVVGTLLLISGGPEETRAAVTLGVIGFALTKLESAHLAQIFARRTRPEVEARAPLWRRLAVAGAVLTVAAIAAPLALIGTLRAGIDHDLDFQAAELGWSGGHDPGKWKFGEDPGQRSEWVGTDGQGVFVFAVALGPFESLGDLRRELDKPDPARLFPAEEVAVKGFSGLRVAERVKAEDGTPQARYRYFIFDESGRDIHIVVTSALVDEAILAEEDLRALLGTGRWIPARSRPAPK
ncbi:MAG: hypothetical protein V1750_03715 [Acidobacteriota bacterium]